jgi:protoheme ferro-lyase
MLNMGGPSSLDGPEDGVKPFLRNLFSDPEIIPLGPLQTWLVGLGELVCGWALHPRVMVAGPRRRH